MKKRLFLYTISIVFSCLIVFFALSVYITSANNLKIANDTAVEITNICVNLYSENCNINDFVHSGTDTRITVISEKGEVLADSLPINISTAENHLNRPEIQAALNDLPETFLRYSDTVGMNFIYYAVKINRNAELNQDHIFIRIAVPVKKINTYLFQSLPPLIFMLCIVTMFCFILVSKMSVQILKPLHFIEEELRSLENEKYIRNPIPSRYEEINKITHKIDDVALILQKNIIENRENARRREEFFANASHELKTPLTAIKGFNELTVFNNKDENLSKYITGISRETDRMLSLIKDMLKLSKLESNADIDITTVSLAEVANEVKDTLSPIINENYIKFNLIGDTNIKAGRIHVYELMKNLIENAVRYNNKGGRVSVNIGRDSFTVSDSGIGILPEEQTKIFERFYRVEKSRSQLNGGTGLGLSIVKHVCALYGWKLSLESKMGSGTKVTVVFV